MATTKNYFDEISDIQKAIRERELHRLQLEKEMLNKTNEKHLKYEMIRKSLRLHLENIIEENAASTKRANALVARVKNLKEEWNHLSAHTEKLRAKRKQYEMHHSFYSAKVVDHLTMKNDLVNTSTQTDYVNTPTSAGFAPNYFTAPTSSQANSLNNPILSNVLNYQAIPNSKNGPTIISPMNYQQFLTYNQRSTPMPHPSHKSENVRFVENENAEVLQQIQKQVSTSDASLLQHERQMQEEQSKNLQLFEQNLNALYEFEEQVVLSNDGSCVESSPKTKSKVMVEVQTNEDNFKEFNETPSYQTILESNTSLSPHLSVGTVSSKSDFVISNNKKEIVVINTSPKNNSPSTCRSPLNNISAYNNIYPSNIVPEQFDNSKPSSNIESKSRELETQNIIKRSKNINENEKNTADDEGKEINKPNTKVESVTTKENVTGQSETNKVEITDAIEKSEDSNHCTHQSENILKKTDTLCENKVNEETLNNESQSNVLVDDSNVPVLKDILSTEPTLEKVSNLPKSKVIIEEKKLSGNLETPSIKLKTNLTLSSDHSEKSESLLEKNSSHTVAKSSHLNTNPKMNVNAEKNVKLSESKQNDNKTSLINKTIESTIKSNEPLESKLNDSTKIEIKNAEKILPKQSESRSVAHTSDVDLTARNKQVYLDDSDDDFFDKPLPIIKANKSSSYMKMVGGAPPRNDSDEDSLKTPTKLPSFMQKSPTTDSDSVDSVEAAIQAAMKEKKDTASSNDNKNVNKADISSIKEEAEEHKEEKNVKNIVSKPKTKAVQLNLDSNSESFSVSAGDGNSDDDDDDFGFYD